MSATRAAIGASPDPHALPTGDADPELLRQFGYGASPPDPDLGWLPWRRNGDILWIGTVAEPTPALRAEICGSLDLRGDEGPRVQFLRVSAAQIVAAQNHLREALRLEASERFAREHPSFSAKGGLARWQGLLPIALLILAIAGMLGSWRAAVIVLFTIGNVAFLANVGFKFVATLGGPRQQMKQRGQQPAWDERAVPEPAAPPGPRRAVWEANPIYSVLVPVYQEASVVANIMRNFEKLDYPHDRLDVLILLEEDDAETIAAARAAHPPSWIRLVVVPAGQPRTKPRACNYGLLLAKGSYVVIFDAEDRPEALQLKAALAVFRRDDALRRTGRGTRPLACVQAALSYYNSDYNVLTRMFSIEYAHWFDAMLPGLDATGTPIPLGGTSNHFLRSALIDVGGWDPYNVTEDADLGLRLSASGYRVDVIHSTTWEEATPDLGPWIRQRTRWIKGYLVTGAVNLRHPIRWMRRNGARASLTMFGLILGTPVTFLLYPVTLGFTVASWLLGPVVQIWIPHGLLLLGYFNMVVMNLAIIISSMAATWRRYSWRIALFAVFLPFYWLLHSVAAWRALAQLAHDPSRWEKTPHGITEEYTDSMIDVPGLPHSARD
ncbi:Glycosyltransferase, catalytic subunit of cellulose synthase and poly-beta-1,6-N-acetylglucosamine synthase [Propionibacterium cyclohexanicum]|uniref:Glycosyltransferase, catalytic subunit of cellulose synthase and poly-beta-1,6-N-acetylglucosamine synthase n=1 Tax=Propionibacterium cyclohexanicum TaxID=64702 RepID=A0A1H9TXM0_9ACTN|nr:glycosyltransferase [Propionibacterium cyclohexanicum]SES01985.1 Glycosyltransferase, catalytic subunit of cellulose synthase and poly-beta-1,6-N-acetylglucosamine synthase [Propionibacterium cyclohexanicum]